MVESQVTDIESLTDSERNVLHLLTKEHLTVKQAAIRRQTSKQAIYKIRKSLIRKGILNHLNQEVENSGGCSRPTRFKIRLHNEQLHIRIIWADERYRVRIAGGNKRLTIDGNTVMLYRNDIEIYSNMSFFGDSVNESDYKAARYWTRFLIRLQDETKTILLKDRSENISRVRAEYAEVGNELAKQCIEKHEIIRVIGEDNKVWLLIDNSHNFTELETTHPKRSKQDMENVVTTFFNDLRDNETVTISELKYILKEMAEGIQANTLTLKALLSMNSPIIPKEEVNETPKYIG